MFEKHGGGTLHIPIEVRVGTPHNIERTNPGAGWVGGWWVGGWDGLSNLIL